MVWDPVLLPLWPPPVDRTQAALTTRRLPYLLQLCGMLTRHPALTVYHGGSIRQLLLWGCAEDPGLNGAVRGVLKCF